MRRIRHYLCAGFLLTGLSLSAEAAAAPKAHAITLGKWVSVQWLGGGYESKAVVLKIRPLYVDGRMKEFIVGATHDLTDRLVLGRRGLPLHDSLACGSGGRWAGGP